MESSSKGVNARGCADGKLDDTPSPPRWCQRREAWSASGRSRTAHNNFGETKRRPIQRIGRRPGCPPAQDLVDSSGAAKMLRGGHTRKTPPATPPTRPPLSRRQIASPQNTPNQPPPLLRPPRSHLPTRVCP